MDMSAILLGHVKLLLVFALCYAGGACLFADRDRRTGIGLAIVWTTAGFCIVSFLFLLSKVAQAGLPFLASIPILFLALYFSRRPAMRISLEGGGSGMGWALVICLVGTLPVLMMGVRMGGGEYPAVFFAADSPYFLHQVHALISTRSYPPPSFEVYGFAIPYHYGFQAFIALASLMTGLKPHYLMFAIVLPLLEVLAALLVYDIARRLTGRRDTALLCLLLVMLGSRQYLVNYLDPAAWEFLTRAENFNFRYAHPPSAAGLLIALCAVRCIMDFCHRNMRLAALFFVVALPLFKVPYLVPIGAGLAMVYGWELHRQFRWGLFVEIMGAGLLSLACYAVFAHSPLIADAKAGLNVPGFLDMTMEWQTQTLGVFCAVVAVAALVTRHRLSDEMLRLLLFAISPYLLFAAFSFENRNEYQIFDLALKLVAIFAAVYVVSAWVHGGHGHHKYRFAALALAIALIGPGTISLLHHIYIVAIHPEQGHEYADNRQVADALRHIPLENTLIATNDLRYPANNYFRDHRQFQLAGLFGHRYLVTNLVYQGLGEEKRRLYTALVRLFQVRTWPGAQMEYLRQKFPVTHVLIHQQYPHADDIPLELVYKNADYAVYRF